MISSSGKGVNHAIFSGNSVIRILLQMLYFVVSITLITLVYSSLQLHVDQSLKQYSVTKLKAEQVYPNCCIKFGQCYAMNNL